MTERTALVARYRHLRQVGLQLNNRLVETLPKSVLDEGGKNLGILKRNVLTLDSEDELSVLMDHCIYDIRPKGVNAVERYLTESPPPSGSEERLLLEAMREARFSLFAVEAHEPGVGVQVRDLLRDESLFLVDVGFSQSASLGMIVAVRVMAPDGIWMTTGAPLPVGVLPAAGRATFQQTLLATLQIADFRHLSPEEESELATTFIRHCLKEGAAEHIRYIEPRSRKKRGRR